MKELKNWTEVSKGYFRFVIGANVAYEIIIEYLLLTENGQGKNCQYKNYQKLPIKIMKKITNNYGNSKS